MDCAIKYDEVACYEIRDAALHGAIAGGDEGKSVEANANSGRAEANQQCSADYYYNGTCIAPINGNCGAAVNQICVFVPDVV